VREDAEEGIQIKHTYKAHISGMHIRHTYTETVSEGIAARSAGDKRSAAGCTHILNSQ